MKIQPMRFVTCLGLVAGSLATPSVARADIPITGGQATGEAAFFTQTNVPTTAGQTLTRSGQPVLFDAVFQTLRLVTPNGTTTTSRFLPSAARFTDVNGNSRPDSGDTGRLEGGLSGVAFNRSGSPVLFQNVPTALNFTLTSFTPVFTDPGSLISPQQTGTAPLLFLPGVNVRLSTASSTSFNSRFGVLETGAFAANLTGDFIGLPSDLQLRPASSEVTLVPLVLGRRIKFDFEGNNATVDNASLTGDSLGSSSELTFAGTVTNFRIQSVGTPGTREFRVTGSGDLDITLTGPFRVTQDGLNLNTLTPGSNLNYRIRGEGPGFVAFTGTNSIGFSGTSRRATQFQFEQGDRRFVGRSDGDVSFLVNDNRDGINFNDPTFNFTVPVVGITTTTTGAPFVPPSVTITGGSVTTTTSTSTYIFTTTVFNTSTITIFPGYYDLLVERAGDDDDDDDDDNESYRRNVVYYIYAPRQSATEVVIEQQGDVILVVDRTLVGGRKLKKRGRVVSAYQVVGLPSRVFPGLTGLRQLPPEQVPAASGEQPETETADLTSVEETVTEMSAAAANPAIPSTAHPEAVAETSTLNAQSTGQAETLPASPNQGTQMVNHPITSIAR